MRTEEVVDVLKGEFSRLNYEFFEDEEFDLNLFGIRHPDYGNVFNDLLCCAYRSGGQWNLRLWRGTTDPGGYYLRQPMSSRGTAILVPGQYRGVWEIGMHNGKYKALVQTGGEIAVYRDVNKDSILSLDKKTISKGYFGINQHRAGDHSEEVNMWSAGCQVHGDRANFEELMWLARMQQYFHKTWTKYTYTLFTLMDDPTVSKSSDLAFLFDAIPSWDVPTPKKSKRS